MAGDRYEQIAPTDRVIQTAVDGTTTPAPSDAGRLVAVDATGKIGLPLISLASGGSDYVDIISTETLSAGDWVNFYYDTGVADVRIRRANAGYTSVLGEPIVRAAQGFVTAALGAAPGLVRVYRSGTNNYATVDGFYVKSITNVSGTTWRLSGDEASAFAYGTPRMSWSSLRLPTSTVLTGQQFSRRI